MKNLNLKKSPPLKKGDQGGISIKISDTGIGIPPDRLEKIFDRFYQVDTTFTLLDKEDYSTHRANDQTYPTGQEGTGIGLAITKELVELHHGSIAVKSKPGKGTTFKIFLPVGRECFMEDEIIHTPLYPPLVRGEVDTPMVVDTPHGVYPPPDREITTPIDTDTQYDKPKTDDSSKPTVLIVEDNADMRVYLVNSLDGNYRIIEAKDGAQAVKKAIKTLPELIISDVMMPRMDGFEFCTKIKSDTQTSHIPVILLTARAAKEDKVEGLETGADDYIIKPFDAAELLIRVKNLIEQRRILRARFSREALFSAADLAFTSTDSQFLQKALAIIEQHIDDSEFTSEMLGEHMGISRMQLHRKIKALTDQSPHNFIRLIRLKKAAVLLKEHSKNITQVTYAVGFKNLSHFARAFKEQFGQNPSQFSNQN